MTTEPKKGPPFQPECAVRGFQSDCPKCSGLFAEAVTAHDKTLIDKATIEKLNKEMKDLNWKFISLESEKEGLERTKKRLGDQYNHKLEQYNALLPEAKMWKQTAQSALAIIEKNSTID